MKKKANSERAVVVTTAHKGVFFGYTDQAGDSDKIVLRRARLCVYWSENVRGFMGLAATGPLDGCRIGPAVPSIALSSVTAVLECSEEARARWEKSPWS